MQNNPYRYLIPNSITFLSLICGVLSLLSAATGELARAGALILTSYILDLFDGSLARRLNAGSAFGLQLDSLVDMVSLGAAPAMLLFMHLQQAGQDAWWVWVIAVMSPLAGAFRLARFNLLPIKKGQQDSLGLTISTGGATLTLATLADLASDGGFIPDTLFPWLVLIISLLMVSLIRFPPLPWVFSNRASTLLVAGITLTALIQFTFIHAWFILTGYYLAAGLARAGWQHLPTSKE